MAEKETIESQIKSTMVSRIQHFREQSDSLTFEGVRRLLEKDLGLDKYALDVHKRFIKQLLSKYLEGDDEDNVAKNSEETLEKNTSSAKEVAESLETYQADKDVKEPKTEDEGKMEDSPVMGLLTERKSTKSGMGETEDIQKNDIPSESTIKESMRKRTAYFKANSEEITMAGVRRLLEKDLELDEFTLDPIKKLISEQLDEVLSSKSSKLSSGIKKRITRCKTPKKVSSGGSSDSSDSESGDIEDEVKPSKKVGRKGNVQKSEGVKKRKRPEKETKTSSKMQNMLSKMTSEEKSVSGDGGNDSEDGKSQSSEEKPVKKKEVSPPAYGKKVEHLKSIIKSCGMSVAPSIYKKAKQVPDKQREAFLIKELEEILSKEKLSGNPTEKEIKEVRKKKERAKELEGIDTRNIVSSSRRRSTTSFIPPPKPEIPVESDGDDTKHTDNDDDNDNSDNDGDDNDVEVHDDSQNDEVHEDDEDSDYIQL